MKTVFACFFSLMLSTGIALGGSSLGIRLVEASNAGRGVGSGLNDVAQLLKENLPFNSFQLLSNQALPLPANGSVNLAGGIVARCSGDARNLSVVIQRGHRDRIQSTVELRPGIPFIVGGFPSENGKMIVILLMK